MRTAPPGVEPEVWERWRSFIPDNFPNLAARLAVSRLEETWASLQGASRLIKEKFNK